MKSIEDYIAGADFLPPAFQLLPRLLLLLDDVESNYDALADLIKVDPGLTADILRVCNSAVYALPIRAETIPEAVFRLGYQEVQRIVTTVLASSALTCPQNAYSVEKADLWNHSLATAVATQCLVGNSGINRDVAFTAGLLHDIGKMVFAQAMPREMAELLVIASERNEPVSRLERSRFGMDHAEAGTRLLERWGFPKHLCAAIRHHHEPSAAGAEKPLAACVCLANVLAYRVENRTAFPEYVVFPDESALHEFHLSRPEFEALAGEARAEFERAVEIFR